MLPWFLYKWLSLEQLFVWYSLIEGRFVSSYFPDQWGIPVKLCGIVVKLADLSYLLKKTLLVLSCTRKSYYKPICNSHQFCPLIYYSSNKHHAMMYRPAKLKKHFIPQVDCLRWSMNTSFRILTQWGDRNVFTRDITQRRVLILEIHLHEMKSWRIGMVRCQYFSCAAQYGWTEWLCLWPWYISVV